MSEDPMNYLNTLPPLQVYAVNQVWSIREDYGEPIFDFTNEAGHLLKGCPEHMFKKMYSGIYDSEACQEKLKAFKERRNV